MQCNEADEAVVFKMRGGSLVFGYLRRKMDNRGSTLVEIIVSILIIGIVFVPLLMGLTNAIKTNTRAEKDLNAESAAVNCMETIKAIGKNGVNSIVSTIGTEDDFSDFSSTARIKKDGENTYTITGINEGANTFYASIAFSEEAYKNPVPSVIDPTAPTPIPKQNDVLYTQFSSITGAGTRPEKITISRNLDSNKLEALRQQAGIRPDTKTIAPGTDMRSFIVAKQTVIIVGQYSSDPTDTENYNDEYPGKYYIQYKINYLVKNHNSTTDEYYFDKSQGEYFKYTTSPSAPQICQSDAAGGPNTLLIFYATLKDMSENATSPNAKVLNDANQKETIVFKKLIPGEMKLYTFISNVDLSNPTNYNSSSMRFNVQNESSSSGNSGDVQIYCSVTPDKVTLDSTEIAMLGTYNNSSANGDFSTISNITEKKSGKKMYDVTVEIYDTTDVRRASKTSTIIE